MASDLQEICDDLMAALKGAPAMIALAEKSARDLDRLAAQAAHTTRSSEQVTPRDLLELLGDASRRCKTISNHLNSADKAAREFVARAVGGAYGPESATNGTGSAAPGGAGPGLSGEKRGILAGVADELPQGVSLFSELSADERRLRAFAASYVPPNGEYLVAIHGNSQEVGVMTEAETASDASFSPEEMAEFLRTSTNWAPGQPVFLLSCSTGAPTKGQNFAQRLAERLGVEVVAPDNTAWGRTPTIDEWDRTPEESRKLPVVSPIEEETYYEKGEEHVREVPTGPPWEGRWRKFLP